MKAASPRVLLVEDDPTSREVLALAIAGVPAEVVVAGSFAEARAAIRDAAGAHGRFDAWMVDAHLPDGAGAELLPSRPQGTIALAHTAATDAAVVDALVAAGFAEVLVKPLSALQVQAALRRALGSRAAARGVSPAGDGALPVWDDAAALRALAGHAGNVAGLRGLFVRELEPTLPRLRTAYHARDAAALRDELHRLRASCGFVGAARLAAAVAGAAEDVFAADAHAALHAAACVTLETPYPAAASP